MNHPRKLSLLTLTGLVCALVSSSVFAESLSYSGRLVNTNGSPVIGTPDLLFELAYTGSTSTIRCSDTVDDVPLTNGVFHTKIDFDCTAAGTSFENVLAQVPAGQSVAIRVTNTTASKVYSFQELHSIPKAKVSETAMQLIPMGANTNEVLTWTGSKWEPKPITGATGGTVTSIATGSGLSGGTITNSGTISIANGGVTDTHLAGSISRSKLDNGTANAVVVNNGAGVLSDVSQLPVSMGGTGSSTAAGARTNLGIGTAGTLSYGAGWDQVIAASLPSCIGTQKLAVTPPPTVTLVCTDDETGWTVNGLDIYNSNSGNVGIGVTSPQAKLDVNGTIRATNLCDETGSNCKDLSSGWGSLDGTGLGSWQARNFNTNYLASTDGLVVAFAYNAYIRGISDTNSNPTTIRIESEGNTTNAARATITFPVKKNEYWRIQTITYAGGSIYWIPLAGADAALWTQTGSNIGYTSGQVGVGTASPAEQLDVVGNIQLTGGLRLKSDNGNFVELKAKSGVSPSITFNLPANAGASGQALTTDGSGNLSWTNVSAGSTSVGGDLTGTVSSAQIAAGVIVDADISASAAISQSKINGLSTALTNKQDKIANGSSGQYYRWDNSWATLDTSAVAESTQLYFTQARVQATPLAGFTALVATPVVATDNIVTAMGKLQGQLNLNGTYGQWNTNSSNIYFNSGNVGIGTNTPNALLDVQGTVRANTICDETGANCKDVSNGWGTTVPANVFGNWPDFILCDDGTSRSVLRFDTIENSTNLAWYSKPSGGGGHYLRFVATTGAFYDNTSFTGFAACTGKSLVTLIAEGRSFGALGGGVDWTASGGNVYRTGGNVGIGTSTPTAKLEVNGGIRPMGVAVGSACSTMGAQAYNSANGSPLYCNGTNWTGVSGSTYVESAGLTVIAGASTYTFNHGFAAVPKKFGAYAVVTVAVCGFTVGDRVALPSSDGDAARQTSVFANATRVGYVKKTEAVFRCPDQSSDTALSPTNFNLVLWAEY